MTSAPEKKVLFIITKSNWGGAQRYVYDLAAHMPNAVVALGGDGLLKQKLEEKNIRTIQVRSFQRDISLAKEFGAFFELLAIIRKEKPDAVHLNSSKAGGLGALAARLAGTKKIIFTAHGWPFAERRNILWRLFAYLGSWATALLSHVVITVSKRDLALGERMPFCKAKMRLVHNGIDLHPMYGSGDVIRLVFPPGAKIVGTIGELTKNKNQLALIEQARNDPNMYVAIIGDGEDRARLEERIREYALQDRVKLFGFLPASEVLRGFDIFALPSLKEGLPYVLLEAKAAGLPIRANRIGGIPDILDAPNLHQFELSEMVHRTFALY